MRAKPTSDRFAALSMSSSESRMTSGLRRVSTPAVPTQKIRAETTSYQAIGMLLPLGRPAGLELGLGTRPAERADVAAHELADRDVAHRDVAGGAPAGQDHRADRSHEEQQRGDLEGD